MNKPRLRTRAKLLIATAIVAAMTPVFIRGFDWLSSYKRPDPFGIVVHRVDTDRKVVALTYDDGPNPPYTGQILDALKMHNVKATFFVIGQHALQNPQEIHRMMQEGHEIGNHTWSHSPLVIRSPSFIRREIGQTDALLRSLGCTNEILFRAPEGRKLIVLPWVLSKLQRTHILFDVVAIDWEHNSVETMLARVTNGVRPGSIILLHDGGGDRSSTVVLTERVINSLERDGYTFCTVSQLLRYSNTAKHEPRN